MQIEVVVHPNSKSPKIIRDITNTLHVYVSEPAKDFKANNATIKALAKHFNTSKSKVILEKGHKNKVKKFNIFDEL